MEMLANELLMAAAKVLLGYGVLGVATIVLSIALWRTSRKLIAVLERKGKKTDKQSEIQAKLLEGNLELSRTLMDTAIAQSETTKRLFSIMKISGAKTKISQQLLELGNEIDDDQE
jgi:hypothetical protein